MTDTLFPNYFWKDILNFSTGMMNVPSLQTSCSWQCWKFSNQLHDADAFSFILNTGHLNFGFASMQLEFCCKVLSRYFGSKCQKEHISFGFCHLNQISVQEQSADELHCFPVLTYQVLYFDQSDSHLLMLSQWHHEEQCDVSLNNPVGNNCLLIYETVVNGHSSSS